jgi:23S rRNA pseudouridine955/2504/2580 synthase
VRVSDKVQEKAERPAPAREFPILLEDEHLLAIDKPAGVAVHGGSGVSFGVIEQLRQARPEAKFLELVHRLDRETSGILLVAKKRSALTSCRTSSASARPARPIWRWCGQLAGQQEGHRLPAAQIPAADGERRVRVTTADDPDAMRAHPGQGAQPARAAPAGPAGHELLEVTIKTGRTHQIRVHLASQGHPSWATTNTAISISTAVCKSRGSNACSCTPGG